MFTWPLKRGCYQPQSRCMFAFALGRRLARTRVRAHAQRGSFELARVYALPPRGPVEGHAFVSRCQDAGVCSCASRSVRFIFFSRGCPFVCGPVSFHPTPAPSPSPPPPTTTPEDSSGSVVFQTLWHCLFRKHDPAFRSRRFLPRHPKDEPSQTRRRYCSLTKAIRAVSSSKTRLDPPLIAAPSAVLSSKVIPATCRARARTHSTLSCLQRANLDFPIYVLFNASLPTLMTSAE